MSIDQISERCGRYTIASGPRIWLKFSKLAEGIPETAPFSVGFVLAEPAKHFLGPALRLERTWLQGCLEQVLHLAARQPGALEPFGRLPQVV
ncbi:MAG: hypothetical protein KatS3mg105_4321 [Gemmatales bacterium]|nr:MAG: hypothetical protein KatS3mg105_4321 [Gemmatales bacterium]